MQQSKSLREAFPSKKTIMGNASQNATFELLLMYKVGLYVHSAILKFCEPAFLVNINSLHMGTSSLHMWT